MKKSYSLFIVLCVAIPSVIHGQKSEKVEASVVEGLQLHSLFQSNMVLQRNKPVVVWGWNEPGETVSVSFGGNTSKTQAAEDRSWTVTLPAMKAHANPQAMIIESGARKLILDKVLVGDIWVIGGQSNMQHPLSRVEGGSVEIASANFPEIRLLTIPPVIDDKVKVNFPRREKGKQVDGDWDICSPATVREFSAIGYAFGRRLHMVSQVPMGLIDVSRWGTTVESWTPRPVLESIESDAVKIQLKKWEDKIATFDPQKDLDFRIQRYKKHKPEGKNPPTEFDPGPQVNQNYPGNCYVSFIAPIAGSAIKGAIFHQGFNNSRPDAAELYYKVFPQMITSWRTAFKNPSMPFGIISLCTDSMPQTLDNFTESMLNSGIYVREAQYKTFLDFHKSGDKNVGFASSFNLRHAWYHPQNKIPAGERIARWALSTQYGFEKNIHWQPPMITKMEKKEGAIQLHFDNQVAAKERGDDIVGFAISGKDKKFQPAKAKFLVVGKDKRGKPQYNSKVLVLSSPHVAEPIHYRYAWARNPMGNLRMSNISHRDISFATQRSDDWAFWDVPYMEPPVDKGESRETNAKLREVLQIIDLERRVKDAENLLESDRARYEELKKTYTKP